MGILWRSYAFLHIYFSCFLVYPKWCRSSGAASRSSHVIGELRRKTPAERLKVRDAMAHDFITRP